MGVSEVITRKVGMNLATKLILLLVATLSFSAVLAMQPITIPMEIRNSTGGIANDTSFDINFTFYDRPTGGVLLFNQTQTLTTDRFGRIFAIVNTTGFNGTAPVWLELNVSNITMSPRMQLTAALFAINSERLQNQTRTTLSVGNLTTSNLTLQGNLTHYLGGVLINSTGGINASAVGFGSVPQGVLDLGRVWTTLQNFTAGVLTTSLNVSGSVNITGSSTANNLLAVYSATGTRLFAVHHSGDVINAFIKLNISDSGEDAALRVGGDIGTVLRVSTIGGGFTHIQGTLNITNLTAGTSPNPTLLIDSTGAINASAVGFGLIPQGVLNLYRAWTQTQNFTNYTYIANITLGGELNHTVAGTLINSTGGINASAVGFGTLPSGVLPGSLPQTTITNNWTAGQRFANVNISGNVNITLSTLGTKPLVVYHSDGIERFSVETGNTQINMASEVNITQTGIPALAVRAGGGTLYFVVDTFSGNTSAFNIFHAVNNAFLGNATLKANGILNHSTGGLLVNETGGINASAVGFGSIPQGVLDAARFWTFAQVFVNTNFTGPVNVTSNTDTLGTSIFAVRNITGAALFRVGLDSAGRSAINFMASSVFNITLHNSGSFVIRKDAEPILDISYPTGSGSIVSVASTFNITNLTVRGLGPSAILLVNNTGAINASAVGFGTLPDAVMPIYNQTSLVPNSQIRTHIVFGTAYPAVNAAGGSSVAEVLVNFSQGFTAAYTYAVTAMPANGTPTSFYVPARIINLNGSQFNLTIDGGVTTVANFTWMAVGY